MLSSVLSSKVDPETTWLVACARCGGRLKIGRPGWPVACPHCEAHLDVPEDSAALIGEPTLPVLDECGTSSIFDEHDSVAEAVPVQRVAPDRAAAAGRGRPAAVVSRRLFVFVLVYASLASAVCLALAFVVAQHRTSQLESLPDVVPRQDRQGEILREVWPEQAQLPPGHTLRLGETGRFGNLRVTPLRVTREPLAFTHYQGTQTRPPAGTVLKLWLKFENFGGVPFAPLDRELLFTRVVQSGRDYRVRANNFLAPAGDRSADSLVLVFDHVTSGDWDLAGQQLGQVLAAGETGETYIPTGTDLPNLSGPLVWRMHLRKGIASNGWGVTTLVEVVFDADDVHAS